MSDEWGSDNGSEHELKVGSDAGSEGGDKPEKVTYEPEYDADEDDNLYEQGMQTGIEFDKYFDIPATVTGEDWDQEANKITTFEACKFDAGISEAIKRCKWTKPTPIQQHTIPIVAAKRDLMACAQTGSGKTAAFALPIIQALIDADCEGEQIEDREPIHPECLIVAPTRELVQQIQRDIVKLLKPTKLKCQFTCGGHATIFQKDQMRRGCNILVATPGRLQDFANKGFIDLEQIKFLVLDEADRMLEMGFRSVIDEMCAKMPDKEARTTLMFSATFPEAVQTQAKELLKESYLFAAIGMVGGASETVTQEIIECERKESFDVLKGIVENIEANGNRTLVFVETKRQTDFIASKLCQMKLPATSIHGDRQQREREEALRTFKSGETPILIATDVASRGLDIPGVEHVINCELPKDIDDYVHRIGRTGRAGNKGKATSFFDPSNDKNVELAPALVNILTNAKQVVPEFLQQLAGDGAEAPAAAAAGGDDDDDDGW